MYHRFKTYSLNINSVCREIQAGVEGAEVVEKVKWVKRVEYPMNCNWKVFVDNYLDGG